MVFCWSFSILRRKSCTVPCSETTVLVSSWERVCDEVSIADYDQSSRINDMFEEILDWDT
jgi:hypothetical protein